MAIGFKLGRLSDYSLRSPQAFPWETWRNEIEVASSAGIECIEWKLDYDDFDRNPLICHVSRSDIKKLLRLSNISIPSVTADCFMQYPLHKTTTALSNKLVKDFKKIIRCLSDINGEFIVLPLLDNGTIETEKQQSRLISIIQGLYEDLDYFGVKVLFEIDFNPQDLAAFMTKFDDRLVGINYDSGNSGSLGFCSEEEWSLCGKYIKNIHIKDRNYQGGSVPLGCGSVDFDSLFDLIKGAGYSGNFILETYRAPSEDHLALILKYKKFVEQAMKV